MKHKSLIFFLALFLTAHPLCLWNGALFAASKYKQNSGVEDKAWKRVRPYLLPSSHPARSKLDRIFKKSYRVLENRETLAKAGFENTKPEKRTHITVTTHPALPGMIIKLYTDSQNTKHHKAEWRRFLSRVEGVNRIRDVIIKYKLMHRFKAPRKWIYPVPLAGGNPSNPRLKHFILIEEKMDLIDKEANIARWASGAVTRLLLDDLFALTTKAGFNDSLSPDNIPFCADGRIAFIDTERVGWDFVRYGTLTPFLKPEKAAYWHKKYK